MNLEVQRNDVKPGKLLGSMRQGAQHGQSGLWDQQQNWDAYHGVEENLQIHCPEIDKPIAALLADLEQRRQIFI